MIEVIGVPAEGLDALPARLREQVLAAPVLVGSPRLLALVPARPGQQRHPWPSPMLPALEDFLAQLGEPLVVLATGDPLVSGVGSTLIARLRAKRVRVHPAVSSVALARARMGWSAESVTVVSLVSRPVAALRPAIAPGGRILALSAGAQTPGEVAQALVSWGIPTAALTVLADLGADAESRVEGTAADPPAVHSALTVVAIEVPADADLPGRLPGLAEEEFEHDGQITKREMRALAVAALRPMPGQVLWDLGAGSGSVAIEWCRAADRARAVAIERDPVRAERIARNAAAHGVPLTVEVGDSVERIADLPDPDAVFVGGGGSTDLIERSWQRMRAGARLVVHAVTLDTESTVVAAHAEHGGRLVRVGVEQAQALGSHLSWTPARAIVQWSVTKTVGGQGR